MSVHEAGRGLRWTSTKRIHPSAVCSVSLGTDPDDGFTLHAFKLVKGGLGKVRAEVCIVLHTRVVGSKVGTYRTPSHLVSLFINNWAATTLKNKRFTENAERFRRTCFTCFAARTRDRCR